MKVVSVFVGVALATTVSFGAYATDLTITNVETGNGDLGNVVVGGGYGTPWTTPILFTDSLGQTLVVFCDDLNHIVYVGGGQHLDYATEQVTLNGLGQPITIGVSNEMGQLANIGRSDYAKGNEDGAIAAQAAIWGIEYGVSVSSTDSTIETDILQDLKVKDNGRGYAFGIYSTDGYPWQAQITGGVPEPSSWALMLLGFAGLGFAGYRKATNGRVLTGSA